MTTVQDRYSDPVFFRSSISVNYLSSQVSLDAYCKLGMVLLKWPILLFPVLADKNIQLAVTARQRLWSLETVGSKYFAPGPGRIRVYPTVSGSHLHVLRLSRKKIDVTGRTVKIVLWSSLLATISDTSLKILVLFSWFIRQDGNHEIFDSLSFWVII
jgi:hypothetical protein